MAYEVTAQFDPRDVRLLLSALAPKQWAFATALALTRVGQRVKTVEKATMASALDRPTRFTLNSLYLEKATRQRPQARVWFKDWAPKGTPAGKYLMPQVHGGSRPDKRFERALRHHGKLRSGKQLVPASGAPLDAHGNVKAGLHTRILSQVRAQRDPTANETPKSRKRNRRKLSGRYFYGNPGGRGRGIWERISGGRVLGGRMRNGVRPVFLERRPNHYKPRFAFFDVAERVAGDAMQGEFAKAADQTLRTAR